MPGGNDWTPDASGPLLLRTRAAEILLAVSKERVYTSALRRKVKGAHQVTSLRVKELLDAGLLKEHYEPNPEGKGILRMLEVTTKGRTAARKLQEAIAYVEPPRRGRK